MTEPLIQTLERASRREPAPLSFVLVTVSELGQLIAVPKLTCTSHFSCWSKVTLATFQTPPSEAAGALVTSVTLAVAPAGRLARVQVAVEPAMLQLPPGTSALISAALSLSTTPVAAAEPGLWMLIWYVNGTPGVAGSLPGV